MTASFDLGALAARRARLLPDVWRVTRPAEAQQTPELDANGDVIAADPPEVHKGPGMLSDPASGASVRSGSSVADQSGVPNQRVLKLGNDADLQPGDVAECLSARWAPGMVGDRYVVVGEEDRSVALYRRYVVRGSSWLPS